MSDLVGRQAVVECVYEALRTPPLKGVLTDTMSLAISMVNNLPSAQQKPLKYTGESICLYCQTVNCDGCMYEPMKEV